MALKRGVWAVLLLGGMVAVAACRDQAASRDTQAIRQKVSEIAQQEAAERSEPKVDVDEACAGVSQADIDRVEERMKHLNEDLVVLDAQDMKVLRCSRSKR